MQLRNFPECVRTGCIISAEQLGWITGLCDLVINRRSVTMTESKTNDVILVCRAEQLSRLHLKRLNRASDLFLFRKMKSGCFKAAGSVLKTCVIIYH